MARLVNTGVHAEPGGATVRQPPRERRRTASLECGLLSFALAFGPGAFGLLLGRPGPDPGSALDWVMLTLIALAFASVPLALAALVLVVADLWRRQGPLWQLGVATVLAVAVIYAWKDFP
jgi:hypothetical protein